MLAREDFLFIVEHAPLVSIDLVIRNPEGKFLLGLRANEPAKNSWFVPGGRIHKNERVEQAFVRICESELGLALPFSHAHFLGYFQHLYPTNAGEKPGFGTHYVVLGFQLNLAEAPAHFPMEQHRRVEWFDAKTLLATPEVHQYTKDYFAPAELRK